LVQQAKEYAERPENQERIRKLMKSRPLKPSSSKPSPAADHPSYETPPST
jgi:hypothetical protein